MFVNRYLPYSANCYRLPKVQFVRLIQSKLPPEVGLSVTESLYID